MLVSAIIYQDMQYNSQSENASVNTELYLFNNRRWVDVDHNREFRERIGPVGLHSSSDTVGTTEVTRFPPKELYCTRNANGPLIELDDNWTVEDQWLFAVSVPPGAAASTLIISDSDGRYVPFVLGIGTSGRLCYYLYAQRRTMLFIQAAIVFDENLFISATQSVGRIKTHEEHAARAGIHTAEWELKKAVTQTTEPRGRAWAIDSTTHLAKELGELVK